MVFLPFQSRSEDSKYCKMKSASRLRSAIFVWLMAVAFSISHAQESPTNQVSPPVQTSLPGPALYKKMSLQQLMDQDVTSVAKEPQPYGQAPAAIQVITGDEIRRSGASSIPEALRLADNLDVAQVSSSGWDISARGFNSSVGNKLLVLIDGRSVYTPLFSGVIWNAQDYLLEDIDRIEVISGPGGTLWGANAVNGVINITSKSARDTQGLYVEGGGGSQLQGFGAVRYGGTLASNVFYRVYGKYFDRGAEVFPDGTSAHDDWDRGQGGFRIDADGSPQNQFTLQGDLYGGDTHTVPGGEGNPEADGLSSGGNVLGRWTHTFEEDSDMTLQLYYDRTHLAAPFQGSPAEPAFPPFFPASPAIPAGTLKDDLDTYDLDFQDRFHLGTWNTIVWGLGYRFTHDVVGNAPTVAFEPAIQDQSLASGFVQDQIKLHEQVYLTLGSKVEHNDYTGVEYEPSGRLQWNITDNQMLWGAVSRAVRTPSRYDRDLFQPSPNDVYLFHFVGNNNFESETLLAYELGYRAQITSKVSGSVSAFYNEYSDLRSATETIVAGNPTSLIDITFGNNLAATTYGVELSTDYQMLEWWRLHAGYDLLEERVNIGPGGDAFHGLNETADPKNQVFFRSSMDLPCRTELDAAFRWIDTVHNNNGGTPGTIPSYGEIDVRLGWHATKNIEFSLVGQNLINDQHAEAGFPGPTQEQIVRSVYAKVSLSW
jgi:iron complex outermembrane receptor protein